MIMQSISWRILWSVPPHETTTDLIQGVKEEGEKVKDLVKKAQELLLLW